MPHLRLSSGETRFDSSGAGILHIAINVVAPGPARDGVPVEDVHLERHGFLGLLAARRRRFYVVCLAVFELLVFLSYLRSNAVRVPTVVLGELWAHDDAPNG